MDIGRAIIQDTQNLMAKKLKGGTYSTVARTTGVAIPHIITANVKKT